MKRISSIFQLSLTLLILLLISLNLITAQPKVPRGEEEEEKYGYLSLTTINTNNEFIKGAVLRLYKGSDLYKIYEIDTSNIILRLPEGSYQIRVERRGYKDYIERVFIEEGKTVKIYAVLIPTVNIIGPSIQSILLPFHEKKSLSIEIVNEGKLSQEVLLVMTTNSSIVLPILKHSGVEISNNTSMVLEPNRPLKLNLELVPISDSGTSSISIHLYYEDIEISRNLIVTLTKESLDLLRLNILSLSSEPGAKIELTAHLKNPFWSDEKFTISSSAPTGWNVSVKYRGIPIHTLVLEPNEVVELKVCIEIPEDVSEGVYNVLLRTEVAHRGFSEEKSLTVAIGREVRRELSLEVQRSHVYANIGSRAKYKLKLVSRGYEELLVRLSVENLPEALSYWFEDEVGNRISSIYLHDDSGCTIFLCVQVSEDARVGIFNFTLRITADNITLYRTLYLDVTGRYGLTVETEEFSIDTYAGEEVTFDFTLKNTGTLTLTDVTCILESVPEGFEVEITPEKVSILKPGESITFTLTITVDPTKSVGDYYILLKGKANEVSTITYGLRVIVRQRETMLIVAAVVVIVVALVLVYVYKRYGRR